MLSVVMPIANALILCKSVEGFWSPNSNPVKSFLIRCSSKSIRYVYELELGAFSCLNNRLGSGIEKAGILMETWLTLEVAGLGCSNCFRKLFFPIVP